MELRVPRSALAAIEAVARDAYPEECCGFLLGRKDGDARTVDLARPTANVDPGDRRTRYAIDNRAVLEVEREYRGDRRLVGIYHSHPDNTATPSALDARRAWPWYAYLIVAVRDRTPGETQAWEFDDQGGEFRSVPIRIEERG